MAEVTFRTAVAAEAIRLIAAETDVLVGAGTVVRSEQVDEAVAAASGFGYGEVRGEARRRTDVLVVPSHRDPRNPTSF